MNNGFKLIETRYLDYYKANGYLYRHTSGLEALFIEQDDKELFFSFSFKTLPESSNGVFHIIEHTILSGSKKYQVKDLFSTLHQGSAATYLNAFTCPDRTMYIAASAVEKDFDNIFKVYADSIFNPLLSKGSFLTEGIRYEEPGNFSGVVFNEMSGDNYSHESVVSSTSTRQLFSTGPYSKESGGISDEIATLTYEEFLANYNKYYVPSNCQLLLYGKGLDIEAKLNFLNDEYLANREYVEVDFSVNKVEKWKEEKEIYLHSAGNGKSLIFSYLVENLNTSNVDIAFTSVLVDALLGSPTSALYKEILDCPYCEDLSSQSGIVVDFLQMPFVIGLSGVNKEDIPKCKEFIKNTLETFVTEGIDKDLIEAALRRKEFGLKEIPGGAPNGLRLTFRAIRMWERGLNPFDGLKQEEDFDIVRKMYEEDDRIFEKWIEKNLLNNTHTLVAYIEQDEELLEKLEEKLSKIKRDKFDDEEYKEYIEKEDSPEAIAAIPNLRFEDISSTIKLSTSVKEDQIISLTNNCGQIAYFDLMFSLNDKTVEELRLYSLLSREIILGGLKGQESEEIHNKLRLVTGGYSCYIECGQTKDKEFVAYFVIRMKFLPKYMEEALTYLAELLTNLDAGNEANIQKTLFDITSDYSSYLEYSGSMYASSLSQSRLTTSCYIGEQILGLSAYEYFSTVKAKDIASQMQSLFDDLNNRSRMVLHLSTDDIQPLKECGKQFLLNFNEGNPISNINHSIELPNKNLQFIINSPVSYNALSFPSSLAMTKEQDAESLLCLILTATSLWNEIRVNGSAYGVNANLDALEEVVTISTYRDPSISFDKIIKAINEVEIDEENLEKAKIQFVGRLKKPLAPSATAMISLRRILYKITDEDRVQSRKNINEITVCDVLKAKERFISLVSNAHLATLASQAMFKDDSFKTLEVKN